MINALYRGKNEISRSILFQLCRSRMLLCLDPLPGVPTRAGHERVNIHNIHYFYNTESRPSSKNRCRKNKLQCDARDDIPIRPLRDRLCISAGTALRSHLPPSHNRLLRIGFYLHMDPSREFRGSSRSFRFPPLDHVHSFLRDRIPAVIRWEAPRDNFRFAFNGRDIPLPVLFPHLLPS